MIENIVREVSSIFLGASISICILINSVAYIFTRYGASTHKLLWVVYIFQNSCIIVRNTQTQAYHG